jgi:hypothetical protein
MQGVEQVAQRVLKREGTSFIQALRGNQEPPRALPPRDGPFIKNRFRAALGLQPF